MYDICLNFISIIDFSLARRVLLDQNTVTKTTGARIYDLLLSLCINTNPAVTQREHKTGSAAPHEHIVR